MTSTTFPLAREDISLLCRGRASVFIVSPPGIHISLTRRRDMCDQKFSKQRTESDRISHRFEDLRHIFKTFHEAYTIFLSRQRVGSHIGSVS